LFALDPKGRFRSMIRTVYVAGSVILASGRLESFIGDSPLRQVREADS